MKALLAAVLLVLVACPGKQAPRDPDPPTVVDEPVADEPVAPKRSFELEDSHLVLPSPVVFDGPDLDADASADALAHIRDFLVEREDVTLLRIEGHTASDQTGEDGSIFSGERAFQVARWLISEGISCQRLLAAAFADFKPVAANDTPDGMAANRRVEVVVAALRDRAIGGMPVDGNAPIAAPMCD